MNQVSIYWLSAATKIMPLRLSETADINPCFTLLFSFPRHFFFRHLGSTSPSEKTESEQYKYIKEAIRAYPELYFAKLVILGEGESEELILPKF